MIARDLAQVGIEANIQQLSWQQWLQGPFKGQFDMTLINHVEPLDYRIYTDPGYYFGYDSPAFRALVERHASATNARERQMLFSQMQRHLAQDAVNAWIFAPQIGTVVRKGLRGKLGEFISQGHMQEPVEIHSHGGRVQLMHT